MDIIAALNTCIVLTRSSQHCPCIGSQMSSDCGKNKEVAHEDIYIYIPASYHVTVRWSICATLQVTKATFRPSFFFSSLAYLHTVYPESFSTPFIENRIIAKSFPNLRVSMTSYGKFYKEFFQMRYFQVVKNTYCLGFSTFLICNQLPLNIFSWPSLAKSENVFFNLFQNRVILNTTKKTSCRALYTYLFV